MDISYCTLTKLARAKSKVGEKWTENELIIILLKLSDAFRKL